MRRPPAVVTGGAGFLGSHLCERLLDEGMEVVCLDNFCTGTPTNVEQLTGRGPFRLLRADVTDYVHVVGRVDFVLHFASPASPIDYLQLPIETLKVGSNRARSIHSGWLRRSGPATCLRRRRRRTATPRSTRSRKLTGGHVNPVGPRGVYHEAKRFAEAITMAYRRYHNVDTSIIRIFNTHGPRMRPNDGRAVPTFVRQALHEEPLTVSGDGLQTRSIQYVDDLVEGVYRLLQSEHAGPVNIGNPQEVTIVDLARTIRSLVGSPSPIMFIPRPTDDPTVRQPDISLAREALGWEPAVPLEEGLKRTIEWFRELPVLVDR